MEVSLYIYSSPFTFLIASSNDSSLSAASNISNISSRSKSSPPSSSVLGSEAYNCVVIIGVDVIDLDEGTTEKADVPGVMEIPRTRTERTASKKLDVILQLLFFAVVVLVVVVVVVRLEAVNLSVQLSSASQFHIDSITNTSSNTKQFNPTQHIYIDSSSSSNSNIKSSRKLLLDSAELYGLGRSESLIGDFSKGVDPTVRDDIIVATKFAPLPFRTKPTDVLKACEASAKRLSVGLKGGKDAAGIRPIDLYQIHFPMAYENEAVWDGLAMAYERGLVKAVGVSNYGVDAIRACHTALSKRGVPLATNQIQYSLVYRYAEDNGLLDACRDLGVQVLAYSPLALGLLTGKYTDKASVQQKVKGPRKALFEKSVEKEEFGTLIKTMQQVADNHSNANANVAQVALNYCRAKGTIPIPGARNIRQIESNFGSLDWTMSPEEVRLLDSSSKGLSYIDPSANPFPKVDKDTGLIMFDS
mmetsp:Transcript_51273/g.123786  ORF Transcript_51273/g.123786 Transcript_51273/m.123786 type:complete len:473 (+) Transcript_51273:1411-2829(+)